MPFHILVLHGPNLPLLAEREASMSLAALDEALQGRARALAAELRVVQSHHEGGLLEALAANADWASAVLVSPGVLAHTSHALREALQLVGKPSVEVQLVKPRKDEAWRRTSLLEGVVEARLVGGGLQAYLDALSKLVLGETVRPVEEEEEEGAAVKTLGRKGGRTEKERAQSPLTPSLSQAERGGGRKTIGRKGATVEVGLSRAQVRRQIAARLAGELSSADLAAWARARWMEVQGGAPAERGQRELLEQSLQSLTLSAQQAGRMTDDQLVELMARLDR